MDNYIVRWNTTASTWEHFTLKRMVEYPFNKVKISLTTAIKVYGHLDTFLEHPYA